MEKRIAGKIKCQKNILFKMGSASRDKNVFVLKPKV